MSALVFAPREHLRLASEGYSVVSAAMNVTEKLVADVLHTRFADIPGISSHRAHKAQQKQFKHIAARRRAREPTC
jgi:hypothetical protein